MFAARNASEAARTGLLAAICAFLIWGLLPLYLRPLHAVPAIQIMAHRIVWCCAFVVAWMVWRGQLQRIGEALRLPATRYRLMASALLVSLNWLIYVWSVGHGHVLDASLGYFINPLINVLLGVALLSERLNRWQWTAVGVAATGVVWLTVQAGHLPWIALALALSFGLYGLIRKVVAVDALTGLATETLLLSPFGLGYLAWTAYAGPGAFAGSGPALSLWLVLGGLVTAVPLALFAYGARLIPYSTVGIIQYIGPSLQLTSGILLFHEAFPPARALGFAFIWTALAIYAGESLLRGMRQRTLAAAHR